MVEPIKLLKLFLLISVVVVLFGCKNETERSIAKSSIFKYPLTTKITTFDPAKISDHEGAISALLINQIYEGLVKIGVSNTPEPALAEKWDISKDGLTYTFYLKKNVKFHTGELMTAHDVKWSFERACKYEFASPTAKETFKNIEGAIKRLEGNAKHIKGLKVLNEYTLQIKLKEPKSHFLAKLTMPVASILPRKKTPTKAINNIEAVVGTGPFKLSEYHPSQLVVLTAHKHYHSGRPQLKKIHIPIVKDRIAALNMTKAGKLDFCGLTPLEYKNIKKEKSEKRHVFVKNSSIVAYLQLNPKAYEPFKDIKVRKAIIKAINKDLITQQILFGLPKPATTFIPAGVPGHRKLAQNYTFNPKHSRLLLSKTKYKSGNKLPKLKISVYDTSPNGIAATENIAMQLKRNLGLNVTVKRLDFSTYMQKMHKNKLAMRFGGWSTSCIDPYQYLPYLFHSKSAMNSFNYSNSEFDHYCDQAEKKVDSRSKLKMYAKAEDILLQDGYIFPLFYPKDPLLISNHVKGLQFNLFSFLPHTKVSIN